jgi:tetratricopeptide (TPR) repeat protein
LGTVLALTGGCLAPILPITAINISRGEAVLISTQAGVNFWIGNNPSSDGSTAIVPGTRAGWWEGYEDSIAQAEAAEGRALSAGEVSRHFGGRAWSWIRAEPAAALKHLAWKLRLYSLDTELGNNLPVSFFARHFDPLLRWSPVGFSLLAGLGLVGLLCVRGRLGELFPLWGFALVYSASVVAFFVCSRFRVPVLPVMALFSGVGLDAGLRALGARDWRRLGGGAVLAGLVFGVTRSVPDQVLDPASNGHLLLGQAALWDGDWEAADEQFSLALRARPGNSIAQVGLVETYRRQGHLDQAEHTARAALDQLSKLRRATGIVKPGEPELLTALMQVVEAKQGTPAVVRELERRVARDPGDCAAIGLLATLYEGLGRGPDLQRVRAGGKAAGCW